MSRFSTFALFIFVCAEVSVAQGNPQLKMQFDHAFNIGAPSNQTMLMDNEGFLWIGSEGGGIFRWDGYNVKWYKTREGGLSNGTVWRMVADPVNPNIFWIGTNEGLNRFDKTTETFTYHANEPDVQAGLTDIVVEDMLQDSQDPDILWIGRATDGLAKFSKKTGKIQAYLPDLKSKNFGTGPNFGEVWRIIEDRTDPNILWLATWGGGVNKFEKNTGRFYYYKHDPNDKESLANDKIASILQDRMNPDILWVTTVENHSLARFDRKSGKVTKHYIHDPAKPSGPPPLHLEPVYQDDNGVIWLGGWVSDNGLTLFDPKTEVFTNYKNDPSNPASISSNLIVNVMRDNRGIIWIANCGGQIDKIDPYAQNFTLIQNPHAHPKGLINNSIVSISRDSDGMIWFGTVGGMSKYDPARSIFSNYQSTPNDPATLSSNYVYTIYEDSSKMLWVTTMYAGQRQLLLFDRKEGKVQKSYSADMESFTKIVGDAKNPDVLWLTARGNGGLARFEKKAEKFTYYRPNKEKPEDGPRTAYLFSLLQDRNGNDLWMGGSESGGGLNRYDKTTGKFQHFLHVKSDPASLASDNVSDIYQDSDGAIWVATRGGGLNKLDVSTGKFMRYGSRHGVPNDVCAIVEADGKFWLSTLDGIFVFDPKTESVEKNYTVLDGLQGNAFAPGCRFKSTDGTIWFGGTNGANSFNPENFKTNPHKPSVFLTSLTQGSIPIVKNLGAKYVNEITLNWRSNFFEFEYLALNYTMPGKNHYQYMLEGVDKEWFDAGTTRAGRYSGLPDGTYMLRIRGSNNDGIWCDKEATLKITVMPPFWRTAWFIVLCATIGVGLIGGGVFWRIRHINNRRRMLEKLVAERTCELEIAKNAAEAASKAKSTFLANMSHELRTPLNAVLGFAQLMKNHPDVTPGQLDNLNIITRSGEHLLNIINNVLDISKIEAGHMILEQSDIDLHQLIHEIRSMMYVVAEAKGLKFKVEQSADLPRGITVDSVKLRQVLINLIGNAIKYTASGTVTLRISTTRRSPGPAELHFEIEDTGPGIRPEDRERIFNPFIQLDNQPSTNAGTGLGLAISRQYVKLMGGTIKLISELDRGSNFQFEITVAVLPDNGMAADTLEGRIVGLVDGQPNYRLLIVEDQADNRRLLHEQLASLGFDVRDATNGLEAVEMFQQWQPHLIWLDIRMPVMDGLEACRRIRRSSGGSDVKIVALTAHALEDERAGIMAAGCDDFIRKPWRDVNIYEALVKHLGVKFIFEHAIPSVPRAESRLDEKSLATLPPKMLKSLDEALVKLDSDAIKQAIDDIGAKDVTIAQSLAALAEELQYGRIRRMIRSAIGLSDEGKKHE